MTRALLAVATLLVLCIGVLVGVLYLAHEDETRAVDNVLAESLSREIATAEDTRRVVDVDRVTPFAWDRMLLVAEGTPRPVINRALGTEFTGHLNFDVESRELFLFVRDGELVRFADYRGRGRFAAVQRPVEEFTPRQAVFEVRDLVVRPLGRES